MVGTRGGLGRIAAMAVGLVVCACLLLAGEARGARYVVVQCQYGVAYDAEWWDSTGGAKFRPDAYCDGGAGDHLKSFTRDAAVSVSGEQFARWRWPAPSGTYMTKASGDFWHALHDGMEQRIGNINWAGGFEAGVGANATDTVERYFELNFPVPVAGLEDRLLCARGGDKWCSLEDPSWSGIANLTLELEDVDAPAAWMGGELTAPGWHRGTQSLAISGSDSGSGVRYGETTVDGARTAVTEYSCGATWLGGALVATKMGPCYPLVSQSQSIATSTFSDGPHTLRHCVYDFAGTPGCTAPQTLLIDNNPPAHPRPVTIADGGEGWHRADRFDLTWTDPDQGAASPIVGAYWRITGANGYDTGVQYAAGLGIAALSGLTVPGDGAWNLHLWLRDEAGNESVATGIDLPLRFDDQPPAVAFPNGDPQGGQVTANLSDGLAGPAAGGISYRRAEAQNWTDLPTKLHGEDGGRATLSAPLPDLGAGTWVFRAEGIDAAGNSATSSLHADGTQMSVKVTPAEAAAKGGDGKDAAGRGGGKDGGRKDGDGDGCKAGGSGDGAKGGGCGPEGPAGRRAKTRLFVRLSAGLGKGDAPSARVRGGGAERFALLRRAHGDGATLTVPFGTPALLSGRLTSGAGVGLADRSIKVVARPSHGALVSRSVEHLTTGKRGGFALRLPPGTSRRIDVSFAGNDLLAAASHRSLDLRVRTGISLEAAPTSLLTGQAVRLSGRVADRAAPIPRRGKLVAIQYLEADSGRWRPVLVTRTDHDGRFHARYRFRYVSGAARIRLRATALAEERWPYAPGSSAPVAVEVRSG
jgi:hypothetical protein